MAGCLGFCSVKEMEATWNCFHCTPGCHCTLLENYRAMTSYMIRVFRHRDADRIKCTLFSENNFILTVKWEKPFLLEVRWLRCRKCFIFFLLPWEELSSCMNKLYTGIERRGQRWYFPRESYGRYERDMDGWSFPRWRFALSSSSLRESHTRAHNECATQLKGSLHLFNLVIHMFLSGLIKSVSYH